MDERENYLHVKSYNRYLHYKITVYKILSTLKFNIITAYM